MKILRLVLLLILVFVLVLSVFFKIKQEPLSQKRLEKILEAARSKYDIPGASVIVMNSEAMLYQTTQGYRVMDQEQKITENDLFHLGSCSKTILSLLAGKQIEEGLLEWDTLFFDVFPELKADALEAYWDMTLEDLMFCVAGIQPFTGGEEFEALDEATLKSIEPFAKHLLSTPPVSKLSKDGSSYAYVYSNASYVLASYMLEKISNKPYVALLNEEIVETLGLSYHIGWPNTLNENQPWGHANWSGKVEAFAPDHPYQLPEVLMPAGNISMKPIDFAKLTQLQLQGLRGKDNYLSSETYNYMSFGRDNWSLGSYNGELYGHVYSVMNGSAGTFFCRSVIFPESDLAIVIMINSYSEEAVEWITMKIAKDHYQWWWMFW